MMRVLVVGVSLGLAVAALAAWYSLHMIDMRFACYQSGRAVSECNYRGVIERAVNWLVMP